MSLAHHTAHVTKPCSQTRGASVAGWKSMPASPRFGRANPIQSASYVHVAKEASHVTKATATTAPQAVKIDEFDLNARHRRVQEHFPTALGVDDFMARVEIILSAYGFTGGNSIACTNLCRDEVTIPLKDKIEAAFGSSFNTNGLGGVLTCGVTGMGAGLSHSPKCDSTGRERYVFFSFPHIAIDAAGNTGAISRPGRPGTSCACGALAKALGEFKAEGFSCHCKVPGVHDALDPEYTILRQRLARRLRYERADVSELTLPSITAVAERTITNDLEYLIEKAVKDPKSTADYAVITGVQIHNWATDFAGGAPSLEFVAPAKMYVMVNGVKVHIDLARVPSLSPRQLLLLASSSLENSSSAPVSARAEATPGSTLQEIPYNYLASRLGGSTVLSPAKSMNMAEDPKGFWKSAIIQVSDAGRDQLAPTMDSPEAAHPSFDATKESDAKGSDAKKK